MSAKVKPACGSGWVATCEDCDDSHHGSMSVADLWADVHNEEHHTEVPDA